MRLATLADGSADGALAVISNDGARFLAATNIARTLQLALETWQEAEPALRRLSSRLQAGEGVAVARGDLLAPLPRAWQWLDGSAFPQHGMLMEKAFNLAPLDRERPLMYQGLSHCFLSATEDVQLPSEADGIDFEGEFGIITDAVPMGVSTADAAGHIKLVVMINDWSLRALAAIEMKTGFGWVHAKPACSVAPFAVTPDALGAAWQDCRLHLPLEVLLNGEWFGSPNGGEMEFGFDELIAHAARSRHLPAGTIVGSGTVSNADYDKTGSTCISERRAIESIKGIAGQTPFLHFNDRIRMAAGESGNSPFGEIEQRIVAAH